MQVENNEVLLDALYIFNAEDGYKYFIRIIPNGSVDNITVYNIPAKRIPPNALKSLVG